MLDDKNYSVSMSAGGLDFEWSNFPLRTDAARLHETLLTYMAMSVEDDEKNASSRLSADDWQQIVLTCDGRTRAYERDFVALRQGHRSDAIYLLELVI